VLLLAKKHFNSAYIPMNYMSNVKSWLLAFVN